MIESKKFNSIRNGVLSIRLVPHAETESGGIWSSVREEITNVRDVESLLEVFFELRFPLGIAINKILICILLGVHCATTTSPASAGHVRSCLRTSENRPKHAAEGNQIITIRLTNQPRVDRWRKWPHCYTIGNGGEWSKGK